MKKYIILFALFFLSTGFAQESEIEEKIRKSIQSQINNADEGRVMIDFKNLGIPIEDLDHSMVERILMEEMNKKGSFKTFKRDSHNDHESDMPRNEMNSKPLIVREKPDTEVEAKIRREIRTMISNSKDGRIMFKPENLGVPIEDLDDSMIQRILNEEMNKARSTKTNKRDSNHEHEFDMPMNEMEGKSFPDFNFNTMKGETLTNENLNGKVVVINAWFISCKPCVMEMPKLNEIVKEYKRKNVEFVAITMEEKSAITKFLKKTEFNYKHHVASQMDFLQNNGFFAYPTHIVIGKDGIVTKTIVGYSQNMNEELRLSIDRALDN